MPAYFSVPSRYSHVDSVIREASHIPIWPNAWARSGSFVTPLGKEVTIGRRNGYDIMLPVRGNSITSYINGNLVNRVMVQTPPRGGIGLTV